MKYKVLPHHHHHHHHHHSCHHYHKICNSPVTKRPQVLYHVAQVKSPPVGDHGALRRTSQFQKVPG